MDDNGKTLDFHKEVDFLAAVSGRQAKETEAEEDSCAAFGYLRGLHDRALAIEFRLSNGNREWFTYQLLSSWRFNPSVGLLLKFTSDVTTLVLIHGSNLDLMLPGKAINFTDRGLQRHRITYIREMDRAELKRVGQAEPTIDKIDIVEFQSSEEQQEWITKHAAAFARG
ncbi:MAG TPA: hypothetical protein VGP68_21135 [Gemmataceae bacterium]|jgi:hypothetical protein|nr:hypothetical protein [Gemmataceae bacterium]